MEKTLKEMLQKMESDEIVAIATEHGTNWIYIGPAGNEELITKCFDDLLRETEKRLDKRLGDLEFALSNLDVLNMENAGSIEGLDKMANYGQIIYKTSKSIIRNKKLINEFVEPLNRKVVETYRKEVDNCKGIVVTGLETGKFWTLEEFNKKYGK